MKKALLSALTTLLVCSLSAQKLSWEISSFFNNQVFPTYSWAVSYLGAEAVTNEAGNFYGDQNGQLGVQIAALKKGQQVKVEIEANEIMDNSMVEFNMLADATNFFAYPQILYKWSVLETWKQPKPVNIKVKVYVNNQLDRAEQKSIIVRGVNECPYVVTTKQGVMVDLNYVYLSYVNENHPIITESIIPEIMKEGIIKQIDGYQGVSNGNYDAVYKQVYAVWHYFNKNNFNYNSLSSYYKGTVSDIPMVQAQFVRTFSEVYKTKQANCVDGTILMASILTRMGINAYLITTPSHCYLGFSLDGSDANMSFIETTLLGSDVKELDAESRKTIQETKLTGSDTYYRLTLLGKSTYDNFIWALLSGYNNYKKDEAKFRTNDAETVFSVTADDAHSKFLEINYRILSVKFYREAGLLPINQ
jgi:hypothetical protein